MTGRQRLKRARTIVLAGVLLATSTVLSAAPAPTESPALDLRLPVAGTGPVHHNAPAGFGSRYADGNGADARRDYRIEEARLAGFEQLRSTTSIRVRGWRLLPDTWVGQARIGDKWGPGVVVDRGNHVWGLNHRGVQLTVKLN